MKNRKYCFDRFVFYDKEKIEKRLEYMAEQGWLLEKIGVFAWVYRKIEPQKIAFSVAYFPKAEALTIEPTEEQEIFYEFCEHTRWKLLYDNAEMQILYNTEENPVPIETDIYVELGKIHDTMMNLKLKPIIQALRGLIVWNLVLLGMWFWKRTDIPLLEDRIFYGVLFLDWIEILSHLWCIGEYRLWRRKALKAAERGELAEAKRHRLVDWMIRILEVAVILWALGGQTVKEVVGISLLEMLIYLGIVLYFPIAVALYLRKQKASQKEIQIATSLASLAAGALWLIIVFMEIAGV